MMVKGTYQFSNIIERLLDNASTLRRMREEDIPEAFPLSRTLGSSDMNFQHTPWDFPMHNYFFSEIRDALAPHEAVSKISSIINGTLLILEDLYPSKIKSGQMLVDLKATFTTAVNILKQALLDLKEISKMVYEGQSDKDELVRSLTALRELRERMTVFGWEFVHGKCKKIPKELLNRVTNVTNKTHLQQMDRATSPQVSVFASPKGDIETKFAAPERDVTIPNEDELSDPIMNQVKSFMNIKEK
jgi:hypothetical protein